MEVLHRIESDDMYRFGKARIAHEKEIRDPDDVFIESEERRRELARRAKRRKAKGNRKNTTEARKKQQTEKMKPRERWKRLVR